MYDWEGCLESLRGGVVRVVFEKANGSIREMFCTRNPDIIAGFLGEGGYGVDKEYNEEELAKQKNYNNLKVFDVEVEGFRTIKLDKVFIDDEFNGVPGWIELENCWRDVVNGSLTIQDFHDM